MREPVVTRPWPCLLERAIDTGWMTAGWKTANLAAYPVIEACFNKSHALANRHDVWFDPNHDRKFQEPILTVPEAIDGSRNIPTITMYSSAICSYCVAAKNFLKSRGLEWVEIRIDSDPAQREKMMALTHRSSVPQIFIGDTHVGGYDELIALHRDGKLEPLLNERSP